MTSGTSNRRNFLAGVAATAGALTPASAFAFSKKKDRVQEAMDLRMALAGRDQLMGAATNVDNGDEALYPDKGGTFTKGLPHDAYGRVDPVAYKSFKTALATGKASDFEKIVMGGTGTLNGPQGGLAFDLEAMDNVQFGQPIVPPAPPIAGPQSATELAELYWASLLRDVAFTDYASSPLATQAATELSQIPAYAGPRNGRKQVTTDLLFRGGFPGETLGPYISQFLTTPTFFGAQPMSQRMLSYLPNIDYMTNFADWLTVQNGNFTGLENQIDPLSRYRRNGRDLAAFTHVDVLY